MSTSFWFGAKIEQADKIWQFNAYESGTLILRGGSAIFEEKWVEFGVETKRAIWSGKIKDIVVEFIKEFLEEIEKEKIS